jgi:hypothetical protein
MRRDARIASDAKRTMYLFHGVSACGSVGIVLSWRRSTVNVPTRGIDVLPLFSDSTATNVGDRTDAIRYCPVA